MLYVVLAILFIVLGLAVWQIFGRGPRRRRAFARAQRAQQQGAWKEALATLEALKAESTLSAAWQARLRTAQGECHQTAGDQALKEKNYEDSLEHYLAAVPLLQLDESEQRARVIDTMLGEARRLFASGPGPAETEAVLQLLTRTFALQVPCPEALFWQALCHIRLGKIDGALSGLTAAHEQVGRQYIDPAFYLGALLHRLGRPQEALRYLADANRIDGSCPFVTWHMGLSLVAAGADSGMALRALQRALGPRGLPLWLQRQDRAWIEAFPENRSYVRRLAMRYRFDCPLFGADLAVLIRQGQLALAQVHYRLGNFQESADLYAKLLQESPPTVPLLRGLGLALARLERYDHAYKHLRTALEQEEPKDPFTAGYLAVCGALGKPTQVEDKPKNVAWGIRLLARFPVPGNAEWAGLLSAVFAEARALNMVILLEDQLLLCDTLASVHATDPQAAAAYAHLAVTFPDAVKAEHAYLYARAASIDPSTPAHDLHLFARTFQDPASARAYFAQHNWDIDAVEYTYLERSAALAPGGFPSALGGDYPARGEAFLLERSRKEEQAGRTDEARACVEVLLRLAPQSLAAHDRLACLHYRHGDMDRAVALLADWSRLNPTDHWPLVRQAIIEQERGNAARRTEAIDRALGLTRGRLRASVAFLGARLALRESVRELKPEVRGAKYEYTNGDGQVEARAPRPNSSLATSLDLLQACLREDPDHIDALWCLAAVRSVVEDHEGLASQAGAMDRPGVPDGRFHYLGAVCNLAARNYRQTLELAKRALACCERPSGSRVANGDDPLAVESHFVSAWAHLHLEDHDAARQALQRVAAADKSPSAVYARALLGQLSFIRSAYDDAIKWWNAVEPRRRIDWGVDDTLRQTVLLAGLMAYQNGRYEQAAERFREAGKLGLRDRRLGSLMTLALVKAGQRLLYSEVVSSQ
jgi:tetratricopeptide (TPR) repeat protein